jgi:hypothetical protein
MSKKRVLTRVAVAGCVAAALTAGLCACASNDAGTGRLLKMVSRPAYRPHHSAPAGVHSVP